MNGGGRTTRTVFKTLWRQEKASRRRMAHSMKQIVPLALCLLLLQASVAYSCTDSDRAALLAFKSGTERDNTGLLSSWVDGGDCCKFFGVTCNSAGRVVNLTIVVPPIGPDCDGGCPNLQQKLNHPNLIGKTLSKLTELQVLYLSNFDTINDAPPSGLSALKKLQYLRLEFGFFQKPIPADIGKITSLQYLSLAGNGAINGTLPDSLCGLVNLKTLDLTLGFPVFFGLIAGSLPSCIGNLQQLEYLYVRYGHISGPLPQSLLTLKKLKELRLTGNDFTGPLPDLKIPSLTALDLDGNKFTGAIPPSYGSLSNLNELRLGGLNTTGSTTGQFSDLSGALPTQIGNLTKLQVLAIRAAKITGVIPASYGNLINLVDLELDHNQLTGRVPDLSKLTKLVTLNLEGNNFTQ